MGFFNGENDSKLAIAYWTIGLITRQIAEAEDPLKQQDAMLMVAELNPSNLRMILAALHGLESGSPHRRVKSTERSLNVLRNFGTSADPEIARLSQKILIEWEKPFLGFER